KSLVTVTSLMHVLRAPTTGVSFSMLNRAVALYAVTVCLALGPSPTVAATPTGAIPDHCRSQSPSELTIELPPLPERLTAQEERRHTCPASLVNDAVRDGRSVRLRNVVLRGAIDFSGVRAIEMNGLADKDKALWMLRGRTGAGRIVSGDVEIIDSIVDTILGTARPESLLVFAGSLSLSGTRIRESVDLSDTLFGAPNFAHARFEGRAQFAGAEF